MVAFNGREKRKRQNELKSLLSHIHPKPVFHLIQDRIDDRFYIILAVEPGNNGPYETDQKAEKDARIRLKAGSLSTAPIMIPMTIHRS